MANKLDTPPVDWLAWAAGIVDGEGCIQLIEYKSSSRNARWQIRLTVGNTDPRMLLKLQQMLGGRVRRVKSPSQKALRPAWVWNVACKQAEIVLRLIAPWLVSKKEQYEIAIKSRELIASCGKKGEYQPAKRSELDALTAAMKAAKRIDFSEVE